jgi:hypothetical protein
MTLSNRENHHVHQKLVKRFNKSLEVDTDSLAKRQARESSSLSDRTFRLNPEDDLHISCFRSLYLNSRSCQTDLPYGITSCLQQKRPKRIHSASSW